MDNIDRTSELKSIVNPELLIKGDWVTVPEDLSEKTMQFWSDYYKKDVDNRPQYDSMSDLFLDGGRLLLPRLRVGETEKMGVKAFVDNEGNVIEMRVNLNDSNEFLSIKGKALEDNAKSYFGEKGEH